MGPHIVIALLALSLTGNALASIEKEQPVRVTHKNSGPKYEIDDVERTRLVPPQDSSENLVLPPRNPFFMSGGSIGDGAGAGDVVGPQQPATLDDVAPIGRVSIRRIFLVPMSAPSSMDSSSMWQSQPATTGASGERPESDEAREQPRLYPLRPSFWPMHPFSAPHRHHLFGADEASRSPVAAESSAERPSPMEQPEGGSETEAMERPRPAVMDPFQMLMEMMRNALIPQMSQSGTSMFKDLSKEASAPNENGSDPTNKSPSEMENGSEKPQVPTMRNETKEDVVEIDGKKYLRKIVINRHVGENIIFMTKRLIFVPLNETTTTDQEEPTTTPNSIPSTTTNSIATEDSMPNQTSSPQEPSSTSTIETANEPRAADEASMTTTTTTTTTTTSAPTIVASEAPATSAPEAPSTSAPEVPSTSAPEVPSTSAPEAQTTTVSEALSTSVPEVTSTSASEPSTTTPSTTTMTGAASEEPRV